MSVLVMCSIQDFMLEELWHDDYTWAHVQCTLLRDVVDAEYVVGIQEELILFQL